MPTALKWILISLGVLLVGALAVLSFMAGSPKDVYYMVRYAFPHMRLGNVKVGDQAPDAQLVALDGSTTFHIREKTGGRPLVLVFGSFT
jgi:Iodothyronine deiodinase